MPLSEGLRAFLGQVVNGLTIGSFYALISLGYTMVYGVLSMVNFAHGDIFMVGAYWGFFATSLMQKSGFLATNPVLAILFAFICGMLGAAVTGIVVERLAYRPLRKAGRLAALISAIWGVNYPTGNCQARTNIRKENFKYPIWREFPFSPGFQ